MIKVGIAGSLSDIKRHTIALSKIQDICISGCWHSTGSISAIELNSGLSCDDPEKALEKTDALIITDSGDFCRNLTLLALRKGKHVFLYPSVIQSISEVYQFVKIAREANVILKCGRTGQFSMNGLLNHVQDIHEIGMIDFQHVRKITGPTNHKGITDILLGDIEIICRLVKARNTSIKAKGIGMFSQQLEIINARLEFDNGSALNYYCNCVGTQPEHSISIILKNSILKYSLLNNELSGWYVKPDINQKENPIFIENIQVEQTDYLLDDLCSFFSLILSGPAFLSIYDNGFESFMLTDRILDKASKTLVQFA
jgi:predicted dehydrogenase